MRYKELVEIVEGNDPVPAMIAKKMVEIWQNSEPHSSISLEATTKEIFPTSFDISLSLWKLGNISLIALPSETVSEYIPRTLVECAGGC